ncbi:MAG: TonB-dependent receptor [Pseudomonadota bacterium]
MRHHVLRTPLAMTLIVCSTANYAQNPDLEEVIVTGTKSDKTLQETSISVELYDESRIDRNVAFSLEDLYARTPNVSSFAGGSAGDISIRGVGRNGVGGAGTGVTSNIYVDGSPLSFVGTAGINSLWDIASVEILRGPQSTLQGRNSLAGAVVVNTKDPTYDWEYAARMRYGNLNERQFSGAISGPLIEDQMAFRLTADFQGIDGEPDNFFTGEPAQIREGLSLRGKLLFEPNALSGLRIELITDYIETDNGDFANFGIPFAADDPQFREFDFAEEDSFTAPDVSTREALRFVGDIRYEINNTFDIVAITTYEDSTSEGIFGDPAAPGQFPNGTDSSNMQSNEIFSQELRLNFSAGKFSGWVGAYYYDDTLESETLSSLLVANAAFPAPVDPPDSIAILTLTNNSATTNFAAFAQLAYDMNERWSFEVGARYDDEDFETTGFLVRGRAEPETCTVFIPDPIPCVALLPPANLDPIQEASFNAFLPRVGVTYNIDDSRSLSFGVQRGYRAGGAFLRVAPDGAELGSFDAEFLTNYELALRAEWFNRRLTTNINLFYADWEDQQLTIPGPSNTPLDTLTVNAGTSEIYGFEIAAFGTITDRIDGFATIGYLNTEFTDFPFAISPPAAAGNAFENLAGNEFPLAPDWQISAGLSADITSRVFTDVNVNYTAGQFSDLTNLPLNEVDGTVLMNARLGYRADRIEVFGYVDNLLDQRRITSNNSASVDTGTGNEQLFFVGTSVVNINQPRRFGIAASFRF